MAHFKIQSGYTVPIQGEAKLRIEELPPPNRVGVRPVSFRGIRPKLMVQEGDHVSVGSPLFFDKNHPDLKFGAPGTGNISTINYGPRRVIKEIIIEITDTARPKTTEAYDRAAIAGIEREALIEHLLAGCMWPYLRQRPFDGVADFTVMPKAIFVNCMDTAPLANDPNFSLRNKIEAYYAGIEVLKVLAPKRVRVVSRLKRANPDFQKPRGVSYHTFEGKHPAGLVGTHISRISPINRGDVVWYLNARDVVMLGSYMLDGAYPLDRIVAVAGEGVRRRQYYKTQLGVPVDHLVGSHLQLDEERIISGNVLTGEETHRQGFLGFYDDLVTVIAEGRQRHFFAWLTPGLNRPSFTNALLSGLLPGKKFAMNTNLNGGRRAIIQSGLYERVVALDVHPEFLVKAILAQDIEAMEELGILECDPEDFALATYVCPSKVEVGSIIRQGLSLMEKEG